MDQQQPLWTMLIPLVVVMVVLALRWRRLSAHRPLKVERMWIAPALLGLILVMTLFQAPPHGLGWLWLVIAAALGGAIGWQRGRLMEITVDPETHALAQRGSPAALVLIVFLVVVRSGMRALVTREGAAWHLDAALVADAFLVFAVALVGIQRVEMTLRARRLLQAARARGPLPPQ